MFVQLTEDFLNIPVGTILPIRKVMCVRGFSKEMEVCAAVALPNFDGNYRWVPARVLKPGDADTRAAFEKASRELGIAKTLLGQSGASISIGTGAK